MNTSGQDTPGAAAAPEPAPAPSRAAATPTPATLPALWLSAEWAWRREAGEYVVERLGPREGGVVLPAWVAEALR